ncbi:Hsp70 family protein [Glycomyces sp. NPDC021274]|uniref:Hsp70 family protein n=1 Tax=Glycomyces sp. NPDC021274 TaxID=3155120 RepID=UPI0033EE97F5
MSPGPQGTSLGVDFGTSHTIAVVRRADGSLRPLLFDGAPLMPSAVCADADGGILVGRDAVHAGRRHPERFEPNPKRLIDRPSTLLGAREYPIAALVAAVLDAVAAECRRVVGQPSEVTLTVPAEWGPARRQVIEDAAARAGLGQVRLVPEPVAAATYYAEALKHRMAVGASIVVYDLGAGTFDASVVRRTEHGFETVALDGRNDLGGLDIDAALIEHLGTTYGDRDGWKRLVNPTTVEERRHFREFQEEVRGAKERLSRHQQSDIAIPLLDVEAHLTRTELEQIAHPHLEQTIRVTQAVIRAAGLDVAASAGVFLVGGASRMPLVGTMLHRSLGLAPTVLDQPEVVVAEGSVLWTQADRHSTTFPLTRPAQQDYRPVPFTPAAANLAPPSPQTAPAMQAPPQTAPAYQPALQYTTSPPEDLTAPATSGPEPSPVHRNLPPQTGSPQFTPPASVDGDDEDEPPRTEEERQRAKKIGRRGIVAFILVDVLIIAGLVWFFNPNRGGDDEPFYDDVGGSDLAPWFEPTWETGSTGDLVAELSGAHEGAITSLSSIGTDGGEMLFSAGEDGVVRQWSMETGGIVADFSIPTGVASLWTTATSDGEPAVVALDHDYATYMWTPSSGDFVSFGTPEIGLSREVERPRVGLAAGQPVLMLLTRDEFQVYWIEGQYVDPVGALPDGLAFPNFFVGASTGESEIIAVDADRQLEIVNAVADDMDDANTGTTLEVIDDQGELESGELVEALGIVYDDGSPYAMLYSDHGNLHFWDIEARSSAFAPVSYADLGDLYHNEIVWTESGPSLLHLDQGRAAWVVHLDTQEQFQLGDEGSGGITKMENIIVDGDREFAVTGDDQGSIRFWSLGN